ncbi:hypothetical protein CAPTEDRAFT_214641 [Capitella teleta]|uniref:Uncharacterized protein n=1 Tax=Capitella teleta TaxID=283909 RepID=R7UF37_CAPTE|nr:hypothetical protein CAPTEDRAFT_214641 [Capitella teleta]|eukprot:ELU05139.1 hypothetical protein CAPTEDRAFT_214641 [Capitella teleta]
MTINLIPNHVVLWLKVRSFSPKTALTRYILLFLASVGSRRAYIHAFQVSTTCIFNDSLAAFITFYGVASGDLSSGLAELVHSLNPITPHSSGVHLKIYRTQSEPNQVHEVDIGTNSRSCTTKPGHAKMATPVRRRGAPLGRPCKSSLAEKRDTPTNVRPTQKGCSS